MAFYKTKLFAQWGRKQSVSDLMLCRAVAEIVAGLYEADLGGRLLKKRVARPGEGKSGGYRTPVATNRADRWIFIYGFGKNVRANIGRDELEALKKLSACLLGMTSRQMAAALAVQEILEVHCDEQEKIGNS